MRAVGSKCSFGSSGFKGAKSDAANMPMGPVSTNARLMRFGSARLETNGP